MARECPACGGDLVAQVGDTVARCRYCQATVALHGSEALLRYYVPSRIDALRARTCLVRWMAGNDTVVDLDERAQIEPPQLVWLPVWFARMAHRRSGGKVVQQRAHAEVAPEARREIIPPASMQLLAWDPTHVPELPEPTVPLEQFRESLKKKGGNQGKKEASGALEELALVYVPFWRFWYRLGARHYSAAVEAATGQVRPGRFPKRREWPFRTLSGGVLGGYLASGGLTALGIHLESDLALVGVLAWPLIFLVGLVAAVIVTRWA